MADSFIAKFVNYLSISLARLASKMYTHREEIEEYCRVRSQMDPAYHGNYNRDTFIAEVFYCYNHLGTKSACM